MLHALTSFLSASLRWLSLLISFRWGKPSIEYFGTSRDIYLPGDSVFIGWKVKNAWLLRINGKVDISHSSFMAVRVYATTDFLLTAYGIGVDSGPC